MNVFRKFLIGLGLVGLLLLPDCGGGGNGNGGYHIAEYWPLGQGDTWLYGWEESPVAKTYDSSWTQTVSGTEIIDGVEAVKLQYSDESYDLWTNANGIIRYKIVRSWGQRVYTPPLTLIPAEVSVGTRHPYSSSVTKTYPDGNTYTESVSGETVVEGFEAVTVPAGTFPKCLKIKRTETYIYAGGETAIGVWTLWLAKNVGVVMETGYWQYSWKETEGGTNELVNATVGGVDYPTSSAKGMGNVKMPPLSGPHGFDPRP